LFILLIGLEDVHCITILVNLYVFVVIKLGFHSKILNSYLLVCFVNFKICFNIHIDVHIFELLDEKGSENETINKCLTC
jgi:hypothetical protein